MFIEMPNDSLEEFLGEANSVFSDYDIATLSLDALHNAGEFIKWYAKLLTKLHNIKNSEDKSSLLRYLNIILGMPIIYTNQKLCCDLGRVTQTARPQGKENQQDIKGADDVTALYNNILRLVSNFEALHPRPYPIVNANTSSFLFLSMLNKLIKFSVTSITGQIMYGPVLFGADMLISLGAGYFAAQSILSQWRRNRHFTQVPEYYIVGGYYTESFCNIKLAHSIIGAQEGFGVKILTEEEAMPSHKKQNLPALKMMQMRKSLVASYCQLAQEGHIINKKKIQKELSVKFASTTETFAWEKAPNENKGKLIQHVAKSIFTPSNMINLCQECSKQENKTIKTELAQIWYLVINGFLDMPLENVYVLSELVSVVSFSRYTSPLLEEQKWYKMHKDAISAKIPQFFYNVSSWVWNVFLRITGREVVVYDLSISRFLNIINFAGEKTSDLNPGENLELALLKQHSPLLVDIHDSSKFLCTMYSRATEKVRQTQLNYTSPVKQKVKAQSIIADDDSDKEPNSEYDKSMRSALIEFMSYLWRQTDLVTTEQFYASVQTALTLAFAGVSYALAQTFVLIPISTACVANQIKSLDQKCGFVEKAKVTYENSRQYLSSLART